MKYRLRAALFATSALIASPVLAQQQPTPPENYTLDERGVDLVTGQFVYSTVDVAVGPAEGGLAHGRVWANGGWRDTLSGTIEVSGSVHVVSLGAISEVFVKSGSTFTPVSNNGSTLSQSGSLLTFTASDGTAATYSTTYSGSTTPYAANNAALTSIQRPNGERLNFAWDGVSYCESLTLEPSDPGSEPQQCTNWRNAVRVESVRSNRGYQINFRYALNTPPANAVEVRGGWLRRTGAVGVNLAVDYCDPYDNDCTGTQSSAVTYDSGPFGGQIESVTDQSGRTTTYRYDGTLTGVRLPGAAADAFSISYAGGKVAQVTGATGSWNYSYTDAGTTRTTTAAGPSGQQTVAVSDLTIGRATSVSNAVGQTVAYQYDAQRRLSRITQPEGDATQMAYDGRGNVTQVTSVAKPGSGQADIVTSAAYPPSCTNVRTCNQPTSTTDARGQVIDYAYDPNHGGLTAVTEPAPTPGGERPQTRISYAPQTAWYKNASGAMVADPNPVTLPVAVSICPVGTSCIGDPEEIRTTVAYGQAGVANNLLPTSTTNASDGATTAVTYTPKGDVATVDGPLPGAGDTTMYRYDSVRRVVGVIGPDPDGPGSLMNRAQRVTYNPDGTVQMTEAGATNGTSDGAWSGFVSLQQQLMTYDGYQRPVIMAQHGGGAAHTTTHISYDAAGRTDCVATRMNPATFGALPGSACEAAAPGAFGPDRIVKTNYDVVGRPVSTISGFGTPTPITEAVTYSANGQVKTLTDGNGNVSTVEYDGFDRTARMLYPNPASAGSSTSDFEQYTYDPSGNVLTFRNRAGETVSASYDNLGRQVSLGGPTIADQTFAYDNLGRPTQASSAGQTVTMAYDSQSRQISETGPLGTVSYGYDLAGRRTRLTWPDGFWVAYDYNFAGDLTAIRENGATDWALASHVYDNLGRRAVTYRGNGASSTYGYDNASRLSSVTHDAAGTAQDVVYGYSYNPAGQIVGKTTSNPAYVHTAGAGITGYTNNGKNQVTTVNGIGVGYDARQNITSSPTGSFGYDGLNRLTTANGAGLNYDPLGRLHRLIGTTDARFLHDGLATIAEYGPGGNVTRRHIPGLAMDETIASYTGADTSQRQWLLADERGSIVASANGSGTVTGINTYDDYGQPGAGNAGLFQYTGQIWLQDRGIYHYKARAYDPSLGRFLQTDPIGYGDGMNLYAYVGGDPVNVVDPTGNTGELIDREECDRRGGVVVARAAGQQYDQCVITTVITVGGGSGTGSIGGGGGGASNPENEEKERCEKLLAASQTIDQIATWFGRAAFGSVAIGAGSAFLPGVGAVGLTAGLGFGAGLGAVSVGLQLSSDILYGSATGDWGGALASSGLGVSANYLGPFSRSLAGETGGAVGGYLGGELVSGSNIKGDSCAAP